MRNERRSASKVEVDAMKNEMKKPFPVIYARSKPSLLVPKMCVMDGMDNFP